MNGITVKLIFLSVILTLPVGVNAAQQHGVVKWFNASAGYGYIRAKHNQEEVFVHFSVIEGQPKKLASGQKVIYVAIKKNNKWRATQVKVIK